MVASIDDAIATPCSRSG